MTDNFELYQETAQALTGRKVLVRFRVPPSPKTWGEVYRPENAPSLLLVDIHPDIPGSERLRVFAHEIGHILLGHSNNLQPTIKAHEVSGNRPAEEVELSPLRVAIGAGELAKREVSADVLGAELLKWAETKVNKHLSPGDPWQVKEAALLVALQYFWEGYKP